MDKKKKRKRKYCHCPECGTELVSSGSEHEKNGDIVTFACVLCQTKTEWLFDAGPRPILATVNGKVHKKW